MRVMVVFLSIIQTVIECLNYMATGDMPPGSKQHLFVHDPKVRLLYNVILYCLILVVHCSTAYPYALDFLLHLRWFFVKILGYIFTSC